MKRFLIIILLLNALNAYAVGFETKRICYENGVCVKLIAQKSCNDGLCVEYFKRADNGRIQGEFKESLNGKIRRHLNYKNGELDGIAKEYDTKTGRIKLDEIYKDGKLLSRSIYGADGKLAIEVKYGYENGKSVNSSGYYANGKLRYTIRQLDGSAHGQQRDYYESGEIKSLRSFKNGLKHGLFMAFNEKGEVKFTQNYLNDEPLGSMSDEMLVNLAPSDEENELLSTLLTSFKLNESPREDILRHFTQKGVAKMEQKKTLDENESLVIRHFGEFYATQELISPLDYHLAKRLFALKKLTKIQLKAFEKGYENAKISLLQRYFKDAKKASLYFTPTEGCDHGVLSVFRGEGFCAKDKAFDIFEPCKYEQISSDEISGNFTEQVCDGYKSEEFYNFTLTKALKIKAFVSIEHGIEINANVGVGKLNPTTKINLTSDDKGVNLNANNIMADDKNSLKAIANPAWVKDGFAGRVDYAVRLEVVNLQTELCKNTKCDEKFNAQIAFAVSVDEDYSGLVVKNLKLLSQKEEVFDRDFYEKEMSGVKVALSEDSANLRASPNGEILATIKDENQGDLLVILPAFAKNDYKWRKVMYFPPKITRTKDAIIGYIHESQFIFKER